MSHTLQFAAGQADRAYAHYKIDKSVKALIAWFRAELALVPKQVADRYERHDDLMLARYTVRVEQLAGFWYQARHQTKVAAA